MGNPEEDPVKKNPIHIIGQPGSGKTTLIVEMIQELTRLGKSVGTLKHSAHAHELDKPGKDSFLHRKAGASLVTMVTGEMSAVYLPKSEHTHPKAMLEKYYRDLDNVLIEGWISGPYQKIEVWREAVSRPPLFLQVDGVEAVVTDDVLRPEDINTAGKKGIRLYKRRDTAALVKAFCIA